MAKLSGKGQGKWASGAAFRKYKAASRVRRRMARESRRRNRKA